MATAAAMAAMRVLLLPLLSPSPSPPVDAFGLPSPPEVDDSHEAETGESEACTVREKVIEAPSEMANRAPAPKLILPILVASSIRIFPPTSPTQDWNDTADLKSGTTPSCQMNAEFHAKPSSLAQKSCAEARAGSASTNRKD